MKRLLIYLGLLATLLAMPYHAKAETWAYYLYGEINGWDKDRAKTDAYFFGDTSNGSDQLSWTKTFTGKQLDPNNDGTAYFKIIRVTDGTQDMQLGPNNGNDVELTINGGETGLKDNIYKSFYITGVSQTAEYTIKYVSSSRDGGTISVTEPAPEITPHDYYWVSPQVTNNQKLPYFKLVPSRNRSRDGGDGQISSKYYTFTIQDEFIKQFNGSNMPKDTQIQWYIVRDDGKVFYRPESELSVDYTPNSYGTLDSHVSYKNYWGSEGYMTTDANRSGSFSFSKGSAKAYTFILNAENGNVFFNYTTASGADIDYYLIGNFTSAKGDFDIPIGDTSHPMTKWYYKGDLVTQSPVADADSIVYKVNVEKPTEGWGDLYIDINPNGNTDWNKVIRPLISLGNNLDGRALHGGLVVNNSNQSLNPETSDDYLGYTFSFNATTFTYRLEFHTSLYLVGPGVSATEGSGSWDISNPSTSDPRIRLTATQEKDHYRNRVYFTQGQPFRFIKNTDESATPNYKYTWYENDNKPKWINATTDADYYPGSETQFRNDMQTESDGSDSNKEPKDATTNSMTFDLPTGWYYVNFYPNAGTPYYTIEHSMELRDFNEVYYRAAGTAEQRNVIGRNDYNFLRVWSDHIAWNKPDNIDVFVVSAFDHDATSHTTTATLTKLNVNYIPAKTGVILGCKLSKDNLSSGLVYKNAATSAWEKGENVNYYNTLTAELTPYSAASTSYSGDSKLIPLYEETELKRFSNEDVTVTGEKYANYLFGFYRCKKYQQNYSGNDNDFQMGFWLTTGNGTTYANSAFLHLTKAQAEDLGVGTAYNIESASAPAFMLLFDESDDNVITGISDITTAKGNSVASQGWYTLQGVRTAKPTQRGIYIYNGKKVIVND